MNGGGAGVVVLVGGGPGSAELLTVAGTRALREADVVLHDRLAPHDSLHELAPHASLIDVGKRPGHHPVDQREIETMMIGHAAAGANVVRLKGGDPYVFGRGGEEVLACRVAGVQVQVIPGVSSAIAVPAAAGIPLTHRGVSRLFTVVSGHAPLSQDEHAHLAALGGTIVVLMGVGTLPSLSHGLLRNGMSADLPVAVIERGFTPEQRTTITTLGTVLIDCARVGVRSPAVIVIGEVVRLADRCCRRHCAAGMTMPAYGWSQLDGFRIGVTSDRRSGDLIAAFARRGAQVLHAPTLRIANDDQDQTLIADTEKVIRSRPDVLLATTSYGIRRWFEVADAAGLGQSLIDALESASILVRGPKARGGIRAAGLEDDGMSATETTASLVDTVLARYPGPITVAVQLHGYVDAEQLERMRAAGHRVVTVAPYRWAAPDAADERIGRLIDAVCTRQLDCVTFTSAPAVEALLASASAVGRLDELIGALATDVVPAAVGPVTAAPLRLAGLQPIQPERFRMGALVRLVCEHLDLTGVHRVRTRFGDVELRGSAVSIAGERSHLAPGPLCLFRALVTARGAVVSRADLVRAVPGEGDDHAMEVALSRLRRSLSDPRVVATVVKRGYRLAV